MLKSILVWIMHSKGVKIGGSVLGGSGLVGLIFGMIGQIDNKIEKVEFTTKQYVDLKHDNVLTKIESLDKGQDEIKEILTKIDKRLYDLKRTK